MLNEVIHDYLPILTPEEKRQSAVIYAALQKVATVSRLDTIYRRLLPLILKSPETLPQLFKVVIAKEFLGRESSETLTDGSSLERIKNDAVVGLLEVILFPDESSAVGVASSLSTSHVVLSSLPKDLILLRVAKVMLSQARGLWSELHEDTLLDSTRLLSHILYIALHVSENLPPSLRRSSSCSEGTTAINVEEWMTSLHRVAERRVILSSPQTPCSDIDATLLDAENHDPSLLEYRFKLLRDGQALNNPISVLVKDKDLEGQLSLFQIRETRWITGDNGEELEYVVCTGLPPDAVPRITQEFLVPQSMITTHSNLDITFFIDVDGEVMTTVKSLVPKIFAILHLQMYNAENRGENSSSAVEYRISTDCLTHTIHPITLLNNPRKPYDSLDAANNPLVCESTRQLPDLSPSTTNVTHYSQSLEAEQHTSQPPRSASRSDVKKETPADHEPSSSKVPSSPASSVSSSAFWWGANRSGSYRSSN